MSYTNAILLSSRRQDTIFRQRLYLDTYFKLQKKH